MARSFSLRDMKRIPALKGYSEAALVDPKMDKTVFSYLKELGFSLNHPIQYIPSKHRDLTGVVSVGYQAVGEIDKDNRDYLRSPLCTLNERIMAAAQTDMSLAFEMAQMSGQSIDLEEVAAEDDGDFDDNLIEKDYEDVKNQIKKLQEHLDKVRKNTYNESGSAKTALEILKG